MRRGLLIPVAAAILASAGHASALTIVGEQEPNNSISAAQYLDVEPFKPVEVVGTLEGSTTAFVDFFSLDITCPKGMFSCRAISLTATGLDGADPTIGLFLPNGEDIFRFGQGSTRSSNTVWYLIPGRYTAAVRREDAMTANNYTLLIDSTGSVPEPATWLMMITGLGMVGTLVRRKYRQTVSFA